MKTDFDATVPMSTYLVALVISDFVCLNETIQEVGDYGKVDVRVCGRNESVSNGQLNYSLEVATNVIKYYEEFYGVKYPLPKCGIYIN